MVLRCIDDYLEGRRYPMDIVQHLLRKITSGGLDDRRAREGELPIIDRLS
jgi:hypothetical protein